MSPVIVYIYINNFTGFLLYFLSQNFDNGTATHSKSDRFIASSIVQYAISVKWLTISIRGFNCSECLCNEMQLVCTPTVFLSSSIHFGYTIFPFLLRSAHIYIVLSSSTVSAFFCLPMDTHDLYCNSVLPIFSG